MSGIERCRSGGVTLVEVLVSLALMATLTTLGAQAMSNALDSMRLTSGVNTFFSSLVFARSEAVKRSSRVVLCKSPAGSECVLTGGWDQGWIVFHDANNNAAIDAGEVLLLREPALSERFRLTGNSQVENYLSYTATGATSLTSGAFQAGRLTLCPRSAEPVAGRQIVLSATGRPRIVKVMVDQCG